MYSITTTSASTNPTTYYYYCYDWVVKGPDCVSPRAEATAFVQVCGGINENGKGGISVYPNPAVDKINVDFANAAAGRNTITVMSATGQTVFSDEFNKPSASFRYAINISGWSSGIYIVKVQNADGTYFRKVAVE